MAGPAKRSVVQIMKDRSRDVDAAVDAMSAGNAPPKIGRVVAPGSSSSGGGAAAVVVPRPGRQKIIPKKKR